MSKTILITGATDGIGLLTAQKLASAGHKLLVHGRSQSKLDKALSEIGGDCTGVLADFSDLNAVETMSTDVKSKTDQLDILINNAGVLKAPNTKTEAGYDLRFVVNLFAPYKLTHALLPIMPKDGRIVNLSSAAQSPVDPKAMRGEITLEDMEAYAQSKLALTVWSQETALFYDEGPAFIAVNPGSLLATKMVKEGFGIGGSDLSVGADILIEAALGPGFEHASGHYFDNDAGRFSPPHGAASNATHNAALLQTLQEVVDGTAETPPPRLI
ncbi:MAG: SDR family NAD(P)-dependent oxidoreductase [Pseudomonadota bacterium]